jgi:tetratricopeptide (TPR) repeat protein
MRTMADLSEEPAPPDLAESLPEPPAPESGPKQPLAVQPPASAVAASTPRQQRTADEPAAPRPGTFDKAPPRALLIGVAAGLAALLLIGGGLVAWRKLGMRPPPPEAVETLALAQADADKDTLSTIASAEAKVRDALELAGPRARFPQATATLARVQIQWADALADEAAQLGDKNAGDPRVPQLQTQAKVKLKSAFDLLSPALKVNKESPDLQLAFADYYRAQRLTSSMNRYLANVKDDPRAALIQGMASSRDEEGAEKAIPKLHAAVVAAPQSARAHYRLALAYLLAKDETSARAEIKETLRLSPQHERARALAEQLGPASTAGQK